MYNYKYFSVKVSLQVRARKNTRTSKYLHVKVRLQVFTYKSTITSI